MGVIRNSLLLVRRINELQRRRQALCERQGELRTALPEWAVEPLCLVGLTADEIHTRVADLSKVEEDAGIEDIDYEIDAIDRELEELDSALLCTESCSIDGVEAVLSIAVERLRAMTVTDPNDVFYDHGEARTMMLFDRVLDDLRGLMVTETRRAV